MGTVHRLFRKFMGHVDQRDVKAEVMALTASLERHWGQKQLSFCIESAISCAHGNYNLDQIVKREHFTRWHNMFVHECLTESKNYRIYKTTPTKRKRSSDVSVSQSKHRKLSHKKRTPKSRRRESAEKPYGVAPSAGLKCSVRDNFYSFAPFDPEPGTEKNTIPAARRRKCAFCGKQRTLYKCQGCQLRFCMKSPTDLIIPNSNPPRYFPSNGPWCWHRVHGYKTWADTPK